MRWRAVLGTTAGVAGGVAVGAAIGIVLAYPAYREALLERPPQSMAPGIEYLWAGLVAGGLSGLVVGGSAGAAAGGVRPDHAVGSFTALGTVAWILAMARAGIAEIVPASPYLTIAALPAVALTAWWIAGSIARRRARRRGGA